MFINEMYFDQLKLDREREFASRACAPRRKVETPSIRRAIGRSMISIGARLAAEPQASPRRRLARSR